MKYKWDPAFLSEKIDIEIAYIHRGAPTGEMIIRYSDILAIEKRFLIIQSDPEPAYIPMHRVLRVVNTRTDQILYYKTGQTSEEE